MKHWLFIIIGLLFFQITTHAASQNLTAREKIIHLFDRLAYGPRPGDLASLYRGNDIDRAIHKWIDSQLNPQAISDEAVERKLARLSVLSLDSHQLLQEFRKIEDRAKDLGVLPEQLQNEDFKKEFRKKIGEEHLPEEIVKEMQNQRLVRAVESRRQLEEVLFDFWWNHFNVDITKGEMKWLVPSYEKDAIRPHLFGKFRDLLGAVAHSPAMLLYLDNHLSKFVKNGSGINENYARELMELHTLGVDGGYTQNDVKELARILTGWTIESLKEDPVFAFKPKLHDPGEKTLMGRSFQFEGLEEGERALDLLAKHHSTAHFISYKLAKYFVSDNPPEALVKRLSKVFEDTDGNLNEVYRALFYSKEFWARSSYQAKVKRPLQFIVSSIRALGGELDSKTGLNGTIAALGEELYKCAPPTGYKDDKQTWVNPGALVNRIRFTLQLASQKVEGVYTFLPRPKLSTAVASSEFLNRIASDLGMNPISPQSLKVMLGEINRDSLLICNGESSPIAVAKAVGLILGSPEFQLR